MALTLYLTMLVRLFSATLSGRQSTCEIPKPDFSPSARVFEEAGWIGRQAILMTGINALIYLASTLPPWYLVDRWGRRPILLSGAVVMGLSLCATGYWLYLDLPATPNAVVVCVIIFNAAFGYSWGPLPWLYPPEVSHDHNPFYLMASKT